MKRSRQDIETTISFLFTRVKDPDINDWGKRRQVLQFPSQTIGGNCVIGDENIYEVLPYVEASYYTHNDMKGYTGGCMVFGCGLIHAKLSKQKLTHKKINRF